MSNMPKLDLAIKELRVAAQSLVSVANSLTALFSQTTSVAVASPEETKPAPKPVSLEDIRSILTKKAADGHGEQVRALLGKYGVKKVSDVKPADFAAIKEEAEGIGNG